MKEKLTIAQMTDTFYPIINGVVTVADKLTTALNKKENSFLCTTKGFTKKGQTSKTFPYKVLFCKGFFVPIQKDGWSFVSLDRKFRKNLENEDIDIFHCHTIFRQFAIAKKIAKKRHIPVVVTVHTNSEYDFKKYLKFNFLVKIAMKNLMKTFSTADQVWALNEGLKQRLIHFGIDEKKIRIFGNACDMVVPENKQELIEKVNKLHNLESQENVFIYSGRMMKYKNLFMLADSLKILKDKDINFKMIFVGDGTDMLAVKHKIKKLGLENDTIFTGMIADRNLLMGYYLRADLQLFPSVYDTDGLVKAEAAICDTPSVMIENVMATLGLTDKKDVYLSQNNPTDYANKIIEILNDKENFEYVKTHCKEKLYKTWDQNADLAIKLYKEAIAEYNEKHKIKTH